MDSSNLEELRRFGSSKMSEKWLPQCILYMKDGCSPCFDIHFGQKSFASVGFMSMPFGLFFAGHPQRLYRQTSSNRPGQANET